MRSLSPIALALAACGTSSIPTAPVTVALHGVTVTGDFPTDWKIEDPHGVQHSWLLADRGTRHTLARLDLEILPCIGTPCSGDGFRDLLVSQDDDMRARSPDTRVELPFEEIRPGVYRSADRRPSRDGPGDELEFEVTFTHAGADHALECAGYARGPQLALWRQLLDLCLAIDVTWSPAGAIPK